MKTFRFIGMALFAILMCVNFAACSSGDDEPETNEEGVVTNEKKLVEMKMVEDGESITYTFSYDEKSRVTTVKIVEVDTDYDETDTYTVNYTWGDGIIMGSGSGTNEAYTLKDGLITSAELDDKYDDETDYSFTYNLSKQLVKMNIKEYAYQTYTTTNTYTWSNNRITMMESEDEWSNETSKVSYGNKTCKGYFPLGAYGVHFNLAFVHPELLGMRTNQLPSQIYTKWDSEWDSEEDTEDITYSFTNDGYIESCTIKETEVYNGEEDVDITIWTFKWQ